MSKKKHPEHVNHERWLVSYADFITLLFAFFVVLFASGQSSDKKEAVPARTAAVVAAFNSPGIFDAHAKTPPISLRTRPHRSAAAVAMPLALPIHTADLAGTGIGPGQAKAESPAPNQDSGGHQERGLPEADRTMVPSASTSPPKASSSPSAKAASSPQAPQTSGPEAIGVLNTIAAAIPPQAMRVEGHTDNVPIHTAQFATNWELSTARAASASPAMLIAQHAAAAGG